MGVELASSDFVSSRLGNQGLAGSCQKRTSRHDRAPQAPCFGFEIFAVEVTGMYFFGLEGETMRADLCNLYA